MARKSFIKSIVAMLAVALVLGACNFPTIGGNTNAEVQAQTLAAETLAVYINQFLTQTAQAVPNVVYVTATPEPATMTATPITPTSTGTGTNTPTKTPTKTLIPIPCNQASFIDDITVDDGTSFYSGTVFVKTWRVKNTGSCTWGSDYDFVFYRGDDMDAPSYQDLPKTVRPGESVDISVTLIAPDDPDTYEGEWMLRAGNGQLFGVGTSGYVPLSVEIKVKDIPDPHDVNTVYDFIGNYCDARWRTNAGYIDCPSETISYSKGTITRSYAPILENGQVDDEGALITIPAKGGDGMIQGQYPRVTVHSGDRIRGTLLCSYKKTDCSVTFEILAQVYGSSTVTSLGSWDKDYGDSMIYVDLDLSAMDGEEVIFYLKVESRGDPSDDYAQWMAIRITHP